MRHGFVCLALITLLPFPPAYAQWVQANGTSGGESRHFALAGRNMFAGGDSRGVFLSTNNGTSWISAKSGLADSDVRGFTPSGANPLAGRGEKGVFFSTDDGTTWTAANTGSENAPVHGFAGSGATLFAGTGETPFLPTAAGSRWSPDNTAATGASSDDLVAASAPCGSGTNLLAGLFPGSMWKGPLPGMSVRVGMSSTGSPVRFGLAPDYTRPFNHDSSIRYGLEYRSRMSLTVFNTLGMRVALLSRGGAAAGTVVRR